ncbi:MAG TPA: hypothetical protein P5121_06425 [Caldilineaceae bacterium]|nr:hypothetical protein [Caldilineaceae bacterium]
MPRLTIWMVRVALCHLFLGFTIGALLLAHKGIPFAPWLWRLLPAHMEFLLLGWTLQLAMGVAFWILPRFYTVRPRAWLAWSALILLNVGVMLVALAPLLPTPLLSPIVPLTLLGRGAEMMAVVAFALHAWPRVKAIALEGANLQI